MNKGVLLFANNNEQMIMLSKQFLCEACKSFTKLHVTLVTDSTNNLKNFFTKKYLQSD